jgi:hypothetical protein
MPTGLTTAWGYPTGAVANQFQTMMAGDHPLTYELGMTSYPPSFGAAGQFQSPLTPIAAKNFSATIMNFGKRHRKHYHNKKGTKSVKSLKNDLKKLK